MKFYLKRDTTDSTARFIVFDELCNEKYHIVAKSGKTSEKLSVKSLDGITVAVIKYIPLPVIKTFSITVGTENMKIIFNNGIANSSCLFYGEPWHINGNLNLKKYEILDIDNAVVASHQKCFSSCGEGYELNVYKENKELLCICAITCFNLVPTVDCASPQTI